MSSSAFALRLATEPVVDVTLEQVARAGARRALQQAIEDEVAEYVEAHKHHVDGSNHRLVVRNGRKPPRTILTGLGPIEVRQPRVDERRVDENGVRFRFTSKVLPRYLRKTRARSRNWCRGSASRGSEPARDARRAGAPVGVRRRLEVVGHQRDADAPGLARRVRRLERIAA